MSIDVLSSAREARDDRSARAAFSLLYDQIQLSAGAKDTSTIDRLVTDFAGHSDSIHEMLLVAVLRLTAKFKKRLAGWDDAKDKIQRSLTSRGFDVEEMLLGLEP